MKSVAEHTNKKTLKPPSSPEDRKKIKDHATLLSKIAENLKPVTHKFPTDTCNSSYLNGSQVTSKGLSMGPKNAKKRSNKGEIVFGAKESKTFLLTQMLQKLTEID